MIKRSTKVIAIATALLFLFLLAVIYKEKRNCVNSPVQQISVQDCYLATPTPGWRSVATVIDDLGIALSLILIGKDVVLGLKRKRDI